MHFFKDFIKNQALFNWSMDTQRRQLILNRYVLSTATFNMFKAFSVCG